MCGGGDILMKQLAAVEIAFFSNLLGSLLKDKIKRCIDIFLSAETMQVTGDRDSLSSCHVLQDNKLNLL